MLRLPLGNLLAPRSQLRRQRGGLGGIGLELDNQLLQDILDISDDRQVNAQYWGRDPGSPSTTGGIRISSPLATRESGLARLPLMRTWPLRTIL